MTAKILDGKELASKLKAQLKREVGAIKKKYGRTPMLSVIQVGVHKPATIYINSQEKLARELGIKYRKVCLGASVSQDELIRAIKKLNRDKATTAVMLGLPLPKTINLKQTIFYIDPSKNVERVNPTASAVMEIIRSTGISLFGREAVVVGHGELVGKPIAMSLLDKLATVTVCHIGTAARGDLKDHISRAEVLVVAVGKPNLVKGGWIKKGAIVVDVGITKVGGRIVGDVEFDTAKKRAGFITPVPGGVGPLTVIMSMCNCMALFKEQVKR
ncbi:MAG: bifunctional 5,10-methylenetetrahydrofolate dehydrogenase/5,10-methenyltetrahydrofolate cyclohydrolase [Candidatus Omnitrophica bacterium]|nr:bifunctional 5,10-methylenetetrahydrofolate dehydrogenase/5,10-methenyltetrahydrofolate cyclohydrolase [Candidatus Omnitrophota bacterium]MDD5310718.1 bifunctional 5,10-methylenetetrahydrofolate dehydrogenase/5,10-methenyltetrahydrofolate cyclohydrolase [Candidatus Omnitrophota bacterium]MDD5545598.1 bifunctional 5,10-methylenetetrahydrofolate dehydrogenase/5,10-methenyltetrahydrofolate cyclohydrolase [Candidatus Omnitrophota bacterium]